MVRARPGDRLVVALEENPTTGYGWELEPGRLGMLEEPDTTFEPHGTGAAGSGGRRTFTFRLTSAGSARPSLVLRRPWEPADAAIGTWHAVVDVEGAGAGT